MPLGIPKTRRIRRRENVDPCHIVTYNILPADACIQRMVHCSVQREMREHDVRAQPEATLAGACVSRLHARMCVDERGAGTAQGDSRAAGIAVGRVVAVVVLAVPRPLWCSGTAQDLVVSLLAVVS